MGKDAEIYLLENQVNSLANKLHQSQQNCKGLAKELTELKKQVKKLNIDDVSNSFSTTDIQRLLNTCDDIEDAKRLFS